MTMCTRRNQTRMWLYQLVVLPLCLLLLCGTPVLPATKPVMKVYFIPFRAETYVPVTPETIATGSDLIPVTSPAVAAQIVALVQGKAGPGEVPASTDGTFNKDATRLLVEWYSSSNRKARPFRMRVYLDRKGGARLGWHSYVLSRDSFTQLDLLLTELRAKWDAEIVTKQEGARPALAKAADKNDLATMRRLLASGTDPNIHDTEQWDRMTPLMHAAYRGNVPACKALLSRGAKIELKDDNGFTALTYAAMNQKQSVFDLLLSRGASVKGVPGERALLYAAGDGEHAMVLRLMKRGVNVNCHDTSGEMEDETPLIKTVVKNDVALAKIMIGHGAKVNLQDALGRTALTWAAIGGHDAMAQLLLDNGATVDSALLNGGTALTLAIRNSRLSMVRLLLERGATVTAQDRNAAREEGDAKIVALLEKR